MEKEKAFYMTITDKGTKGFRHDTFFSAKEEAGILVNVGGEKNVYILKTICVCSKGDLIITGTSCKNDEIDFF